MKANSMAKMDNIFRAPASKILPSKLFTKIYSTGRKYFLESLVKQNELSQYIHCEDKNVKLWDLHFGNRILNAAGMFKTGDGYELAAKQGAGAFIAGTTTGLPRKGNLKNGILHPFVPLPESHAALNWMGLPNPGHEEIAKKLSKIPHKRLCPIGISVSLDPELEQEKALDLLIQGLNAYEKAGICFIELNESCPNVPHGTEHKDSSGLDKNLLDRMNFIYDRFLKTRNRNLPMILKLSNDTEAELLSPMIDAMIDLGFDGLNLGNTSISYKKYSKDITDADKKHYEYFTNEFGGGLSGKPLKENSLNLASTAVQIVKNKNLQQEFHIIRTGGIETKQDLIASDKAEISLNQWFSGYFEAFSNHGHNLYKDILSY